MTHHARAIAFLGLLGLLFGTVRGQPILSLISFSAIFWVLLEWLWFRARVHFELPRLRLERLINERSESTGTLWAGRSIRVNLRVRASSPMKSIVELRDVVSEMLDISSTSVRPSVSRSDAVGSQPPQRPPEGSSSAKTSSVDARNADASDAPSVEQGRWMRRMLSVSAGAKRWALPEPEDNPPNFGRLELGARHGQISYVAQLKAAGRIVFPGVRLTVQDEYGLFQIHRFIELEQSFRILPKYFPSGELRPTVKRTNSLPRHGIHRLERSGMGSELLELREYAVGDPPKSIAWKASARRDKLLTRQYESEVPVRVHLLIDGSLPTRIGRYGERLLDQINYAAASIGKAAIAVGDPVDGLLIDERGVQRIPWCSGDRGFLELLKALADFSLAPPPPARRITRDVMERAIAVSQERYPELLDLRFNRIPYSLLTSTRKRFRLAGVLAEVFNLSPMEQVRCMHDDARLAFHLQQFLWRAGVPWVAPVVSAGSESAKATVNRIDAISQTILRAIAHARDNEVFVVFADLISSAPNLSSLTHAVKLALAKHHRVSFICPTMTPIPAKAEIVLPRSSNIQDLLLAAEQARVRDLALQMKRELVRLGASVSFSGEQIAMQMVLAEMDMARNGRTRLQGARRS